MNGYLGLYTQLIVGMCLVTSQHSLGTVYRHTSKK